MIENEPGRNLGAFSLGSRVFIDLADLPSTGLLSFGSRASYELLLQVPARRQYPDDATPARCSRATWPMPSSTTSCAPARIGRTRAG